MKSLRNLTVISLAALSLGIAMPSCPGQKEMQQQIETLQTAHTEMAKKLNEQEALVHSLTNDMNQVKQLLPQMTNVIESQKATIEQLDASIKRLQGKKKKGNTGG